MKRIRAGENLSVTRDLLGVNGDPAAISSLSYFKTRLLTYSGVTLREWTYPEGELRAAPVSVNPIQNSFVLEITSALTSKLPRNTVIILEVEIGIPDAVNFLSEGREVHKIREDLFVIEEP